MKGLLAFFLVLSLAAVGYLYSEVERLQDENTTLTIDYVVSQQRLFAIKEADEALKRQSNFILVADRNGWVNEEIQFGNSFVDLDVAPHSGNDGNPLVFFYFAEAPVIVNSDGEQFRIDAKYGETIELMTYGVLNPDGSQEQYISYYVCPTHSTVACETDPSWQKIERIQ